VHGNSGWFGATGCLEGLLTANNIHFNNVIVAASSLKAMGMLMDRLLLLLLMLLLVV
jgi:hypothetical protein